MCRVRRSVEQGSARPEWANTLNFGKSWYIYKNKKLVLSSGYVSLLFLCDPYLLTLYFRVFLLGLGYINPLMACVPVRSGWAGWGVEVVVGELVGLEGEHGVERRISGVGYRTNYF